MKQEYIINELSTATNKPTFETPKYTLDWYIKWIASILLLTAMSVRGLEGFQMYDLLLSLGGITGWLTVSIIWKDRALILLNGVGLMFLINNLLRQL